MKVKHTDKELEQAVEEYHKELEELQQERKQILDAAHREAEKIVKGAGSQVERTIRVIRESQADKTRTKEAREELQGFLGALAQKKTKDEYIERKMEKLGRKKAGKNREGAPATVASRRGEPLKLGEKVRVKSSGMVGEVSKVSSKNVTIIIGNISSTMSPDGLERISSNEYKEAARRTFDKPRAKADPGLAERRLGFKPELDVRGERLSDALDIVMHYVDDAIMVGVPSVRIIHGKGTGALHEEIQKYLRTVPGVARVADEDVRHGGSGVTIVTFD